MTNATVRTPDGASLAVQLGGPQDGPPLLLLPGQANSHRWWDGVRGGFEDTYRTVTFDYRGTGGSQAPVGDWSTRSFAADAAYVMGVLGMRRFHVYGTSMGGSIAQHLAVERAEHVDRLVLACTTAGGPHAVERSREVRRILAAPTSPERLAAVVGFFYTPGRPGEARDSRLFGDPAMTRDASAAHLRISARHDAWDLLPRIAAPTLVLHGTDDPMVPVENAELIASRIPDVTVHLRPGGRHGFFEEFAGELLPVIREFLDGGAVPEPEGLDDVSGAPGG